MLKQRIITGVILVVLALSALFILPPVGFLVLMSAIALAASWEWTNLMGLKTLAPRMLYLIIMSAALFNSTYLTIPFVLGLGCAWWVVALILVLLFKGQSNFLTRSVFMRGVMGVLTIVPCWLAILYLRWAFKDGVYVLMFLFAIIWGSDIAAYFVGKRFGKTKLVPLVSPGKSVQGAIAAITYSAILALVVLLLSNVPDGQWIYCFILSIVTAIFSIVGDLSESLFKRLVGIKDSGKLLPGHGGLLDRIDSLTAAAPVFALGALILSV